MQPGTKTVTHSLWSSGYRTAEKSDCEQNSVCCQSADTVSATETDGRVSVLVYNRLRRLFGTG